MAGSVEGDLLYGKVCYCPREEIQPDAGGGAEIGRVIAESIEAFRGDSSDTSGRATPPG